MENVRFGFYDWVKYSHEVLPFSPIPEGEKNPLEFAIDRRSALIGTPDDVIAALEAIDAGVGGFGAFLIMEQNWADWTISNRSYEMFARYVIPHFRRQFSARRESYDVSKAKHPEYVRAAKEAMAQAPRCRGRQGRGGIISGSGDENLKNRVCSDSVRTTEHRKSGRYGADIKKGKRDHRDHSREGS